jgi:predicted Ser/Thr protein kinase
MTRQDTVNMIDEAADLLEQVAAALDRMGATHAMISRIDNLVLQLDDLRFDVMECDLTNEENQHG